ncbi:uncharacterized protein LOC120111866 isoform X3 [Phoenix dactylifera]|uniref:Uncharacterized protein LOC120111866 isoform X3 n=1 Tax=Phoenix dactylifera TaxID=42345 RepID=A0A8B9AHT6_PHODC|nr:uncharacterized protein LOC120111866 isoform X3 [Phoenix dactylifera]
MAVPASASTICSLPRSLPNSRYRRQTLRFRCMSSPSGEEEYLVDAPVSIGDGFSFSGGKYSDGPSRSDEWFAQGKMCFRSKLILYMEAKGKQRIQYLVLQWVLVRNPQPMFSDGSASRREALQILWSF